MSSREAPHSIVYGCIFMFLLFARIVYAGGLESIPEDFQAAPFPETEQGKLAAYGKTLISETYALLGPYSNNPTSGNRLACANCHLNSGTKPFAAPYVGLTNVFPIFLGREGRLATLEERINGCFERSLNGKPLKLESEEMHAIVAYMKHLSQGTPVGKRIIGQGFTKFEIPARAASPTNGAVIYGKHCISCHGADGQGKLGANGLREGGYIFPPLWGPDSFNDGAGMARILTAAKYIKGNMPFGIHANEPLLTDDEAYDVAAFINNHPRPEKLNKENDYPDLTKKPKDSPYPPYADSIPQSQHKFGPFNF
ncbi:c-type cytochrome [Methylophilus sp. 13]|uniref:c-type cytochrome n=1 Tax=Methylophilus sp. 13 TaxID=2781018 RepID=UPI001E465731|nr:c-type cytochrome [Methylophilus sp. 13]